MGNRSKVLKGKSSQRVKKHITMRINYVGAAIALMLLICIIPSYSIMRYEESPTMKVDGLNLVVRPSNYIDIDESAAIASSINASSYAFNYDAMIKNGSIEAKDATGWTNRTRSQRYDWEHETRTFGNEVNITNDLYDFEGLITAIGPEGEWLPCYFRDKIPVIDQMDAIWPFDMTVSKPQAETIYLIKNLVSKQVVPAQLAIVDLASAQFGNKYAIPGHRVGAIPSILEMDEIATESSIKSRNQHYAKKSPKVGMVTSFQDMQLTASANGTANISTVEPHVMESQSYCGGSCDGYDCICEYDDTVSVTTIISRTIRQRCGCRNLDVKVYVFDINCSDSYLFNSSVNEPAKHALYSITVSNSCDVPLSDIAVTADMPIGMMFNRNTSYPEALDINVEKKLMWNIGDLSQGENKTIFFDTCLKRDIENFDISVKVADIDASGALIIGLNPRICTYHAFEPREA